MDIRNGIVTKIYQTDCAYDKAIVDDRVMVIGNSAGTKLSMKEVVLPESVKTIESFAFMECENLETINIPSGVTRIGDSCFLGCKSLKRIVLPSGLKEIGPSAFSGCENLEEIVFPEGITEIDYRMLADCKRLKRVVIPDSVEELGWAVFSGCENLEEIVIPDSVKDLKYQMFLNCKKLKKVSLPSDLTTLPDETFMGCKSLVTVNLPETLVEVGAKAFSDCRRLRSFPEQVKTFGVECFKNCESLDNVRINKETSYISNGMFLGCTSLEDISCGKKLCIGKDAFKNCSNLKRVPKFVKEYNTGAFENCTSLVEAPNLNGVIPHSTFHNCENLVRVNGSDDIFKIDEFAFADCKKLERFDCSNMLQSIPNHAFARCSSLSHISLPDNIKRIGNSAFSGCISLKELKLPEFLTEIGHFALHHCDGISEIVIPFQLNKIGVGAFSNMSSLERIKVSPLNRNFISVDDLVLIDFSHKTLLQYAIGSKNKEYSTLPFTWKVEEFGDREFISELEIIGEYAFAGSKYLETLIADTSLGGIEKTAFQDTARLRTMIMKRIPLFSIVGVKTLDGRKTDFDGGDFPFERLIFDDSIISINMSGFSSFKQLKSVHLPNEELESIKSFAFCHADSLNDILIPMCIKEINRDAFHANTMIKFENNLQFLGKNFNSLYTKNGSRIYSAKNKEDIFYIENGNYIIKLLKNEIKDLCINSSMIEGCPESFLSYLSLLYKYDKRYNFLLNGVFVSLFDNSHPRMEICKSYDANTTNDFKLFDDFFDFFEQTKNDKFNIKYENGISDMELFIKYFDKNFKRMIDLSQILKSKDKTTAVDNLKDLFKLARVLGAFEEDPIVRQRAITFICDRVFTKNENNKNVVIVGDDIHRKFNELKPREKFNPEFAHFYMENYDRLYAHEKLNSGFVERTYNLFEEISKTCTANTGLQRKLKVTFEKCYHYLLTHKFSGVTDDTEDIALLLGKWFDQDEEFKNAVRIVNESKELPGNIYGKFKYDDNNNMIFTSEEEDLVESKPKGFRYEWLNKQSLENLVLGKYCNCCAHIAGAGMGIMRASMVSPNHQNLVVRSNTGEIIAKSTLYVNREMGYAVFNNVESSISFRKEEDLRKIYCAFMRGAKAFLEKYNENNPDYPIKIITIGSTRNALNEIFSKEELHKETEIYVAPPYGKWSLYEYQRNYNGDSSAHQRLVLKRTVGENI